jgi:hypothetical protein
MALRGINGPGATSLRTKQRIPSGVQAPHAVVARCALAAPATQTQFSGIRDTRCQARNARNALPECSLCIGSAVSVPASHARKLLLKRVLQFSAASVKRHRVYQSHHEPYWNGDSEQPKP